MTPEFFRKLHLEPTDRVLVLNAPPGYLEGMFSAIGVLADTVTKRRHDYYDFVHLFAWSVADLDIYAILGAVAVKENGVFWISYPKRSAGYPTDLSRDSGFELMEREGWRQVAVASMDDFWTCLRFRKQAQVKSKVKIPERTRSARMASITATKKVTRSVALPSDLRQALEASPEALKRFETWSYTHRREYVEWILEAKRADTRERRVIRAVEMIAQGKKFS